MDEVTPGLWIGNIHAASDSALLRANNIHSVLSCMRGKVRVAETFTHFQIQLDDTEDADALAFFPQCISFIENELDQGRGVLVHCQAGMSRSATIAAAYLMYAEQLDAQTALEKIVKARPGTQPNDGFLAQLDIFYQASYKVSKRNKAMRMYYLERALDEIMNGEGIPATAMFASFPRTPGDSTPATPGAQPPRRRIRCKMCRTELAAREHMLDHGQVGPATPAGVPNLSPAASRRPSTHMPDGSKPNGLSMTPKQAVSRRGSMSASANANNMNNAEVMNLATLNGEPIPIMRRLSGTSVGKPQFPFPPGLTPRSAGVSRSGSFGASGVSPMTPMTSTTTSTRPRRPSGLANMLGSLEGLNANGGDEESAIADDDDDDEANDASTGIGNGEANGVNGKPEIAETTAPMLRKPSGYLSPADLAAQLQSNPKLAALRSTSGLSMTPLTPLTPSSTTTTSNTSNSNPNNLTLGGLPPPKSPSIQQLSSIAPPLLINPNCSGYFVEPMKWMEPFLENGELGGKIVCPNKKCGAKLGNYDWAGVCCSCKEWVTPGFCIHKSKVDEIVV
ncbi:uncharacterized protein FOMMEDRAFT_22408 [Fomitiporia mediterranea MF3/22]|uniref:uncharacterized protein n=1 Tax=Fomitiporia mediterranea (strain MF3/22) TaxID=694068 RepID=UPI0004408030|nr:uncharacterized protein FOMMEDRAFT_22408 [Fomitiporia mediterranea MF3/22]EJD00661.1 hypothetical protein FOMMEDRAFT_22408 [Fomitiporia mediterranea MF3/22]